MIDNFLMIFYEGELVEKAIIDFTFHGFVIKVRLTKMMLIKISK